jgi:serine/threonine protein phosphatase PrpC
MDKLKRPGAGLHEDEMMSTMLERTVDDGPISEQRPASRPSSPSRVRPIRPQVKAFGLTDRGLVRATNEDAYLARPDLGLFAVTDGMGGAAAGELAARMAIDAVLEEVKGSDPLQPAHAGPLLLVGGVEIANALVHATAQADPAKRGMGTTFTGLLVFGGRIALAHVGDSRAYLLRGRRFTQMTEDHSWVGAMVRAGALTPEEAAMSARRNEITRAVGVDEQVEVDARIAAVEPGDVYLLSTDGLHGFVADDVIAGVLRAEPDLTRAAQHLVERSLDAGGHDNVTVVLLRIGDWRLEPDGEASSHDVSGVCVRHDHERA